MDLGSISSRYAKALLRFANENGDASAVCTSLEGLLASFRTLPNLRSALENPVLSEEKKIELLTLACGGSVGTSLKRFMTLLAENNRLDMVQFIAVAYIEAYRRAQGIVSSRLTVPIEPTSKVIERLKAIVTAHAQNQVEFSVNVDPAILGGFVIEYDTYAFDASVRNRLSRMRKHLLKTQS